MIVLALAATLALQERDPTFRAAETIVDAVRGAHYTVDLRQTTSGPLAILDKDGVRALMTFACPGGEPLSVEITTRYLMPETYRPDAVARWYAARKLYGFDVHPRITSTVAFSGQVMLNSGPPAERLVPALNSFYALNREFVRQFGNPQVFEPTNRPLGKRPADSLVLERLDLEEIASLIVFWNWNHFPSPPPAAGRGGPMAAGSAYIDGVYANLVPEYERPDIIDISFWTPTTPGSKDGPEQRSEGPFTDVWRARGGVSGKAVVPVKGITCAKLRENILRLAHQFAALAKNE